MKITCPQCDFSREVPEDKLPAKAEIATCPKCKHKFKFREQADFFSDSESEESLKDSPQAPKKDLWEQLDDMGSSERQKGPQPQTPSSSSAPNTPWEDLENKGFFPGFFQTIKQAMLSPIQFFQNMAVGSGVGKPLIFYLLIAEIQAIAQFIFQLIGLFPAMPQGQNEVGALMGFGIMGMGSVLILVLYPLLLTLMLFIMVGINHLCLKIMHAADQGFEGTFRAVAYGSAPMILGVIPFIGALVGAIWTMVTTFFGYKYIHQTTTMRVVLAMLFPLMVIILLTIVAITVAKLQGQF